jgi:diguanylate cyclase (GGDEF)-like protein/PAS domain S-box-containing protein
MGTALAAASDALAGLDLANLHRVLLDHVADGVYFVDLQGRICLWNRAAERLTGYCFGSVVGTRCADNILIHVDDQGRNLCKEGCPLTATMADGVDRQAGMFLHHRDGYRIPVYIQVMALRDGSGRIIGAVETFSDNTARMADLEHIHHLEEVAFLDQLTGLPNRRHLYHACKTRLAEAKRHSQPFGIVMADVDHFKQFNDMYGHQTGDRVLRMVAQTLARNCRAYDTAGRWGGEEFLLVAGYAPAAELHLLAQRIRRLVEQSSLMVEGNPLSVTISMGATTVRPGDDLDALFRRVDELLYRSKMAGRNTVTFSE